MRKKIIFLLTVLLTFSFVLAGCTGKEAEEDAFEEDMQPLEEDELADMDVQGDDESQEVEDSQLSDEEKALAEQLEENADGNSQDDTTEDELDQETRQELEDAGLLED